MQTDCVGEEGLVGDIAEGFSGLDCIFCLANNDIVNSMMDISKGELRWMITNGLLEPKMLFKVKSRHGRRVNISTRYNGVGRVANIKQKEDNALLSKRKGSNDNGG